MTKLTTLQIKQNLAAAFEELGYEVNCGVRTKTDVVGKKYCFMAEAEIDEVSTREEQFFEFVGIKNAYELSNFSVDFENISGSKWRHASGNPYITVGSYGNKKVFRSGKNGISYEKVAEELINRHSELLKRKEIERKNNEVRSSNEEAVKEFCELTGIKSYGAYVSANASANENKPVLMSINVKANMTVEQAERLAKVLLELNII